MPYAKSFFSDMAISRDEPNNPYVTPYSIVIYVYTLGS
jgi:hypothetical protein